MGVQFTGSYNGLPLTDAYARIDAIYVSFATASALPTTTLSPSLAKVYNSIVSFSAGESPITVLGTPIEAPMTSPATAATMRADLDPGLLLVLQNTPGLTIAASTFVLDPAPP